ncbi:alpha-L-rhamnosidase [Pinibacter aurantiacus]|uniref:Glycoside hydrolase family 78 protein n=1 Tax=Pinibacter aurantiacus TaxID=2851599 RepID=A0A9E2S7I9_9BACT|nr:alpha-L-rhamnosidase [Pinibacter aurantiacus]MBV4357651.1 glycoside hydrolase family 78 protein [Pinibacter aurantiacus]
MKYIIINIVLLVAIVASSFTQRIETTNLRCEMLQNPQGIDVVHPRLSWEISDTRNSVQTAYQILVSSSQKKLDANDGDVWNSGKVNTDRSIHVLYSGNSLKSKTAYYWKVKVWTNHREMPWSKTAEWSVGILDVNEWKAKWIGWEKPFAWDSVTKFSRLSARYLRKQFESTSRVKRATAYISGLGLYELYINGKKIGDQVLAPSPTDFTKDVMYNTFDVTESIQKGKNIIATVLGNGRFFTMRQNYKPQKIKTFGFPKMILQLEIEYTDGKRETIISDDTWKLCGDGPIRSNNEYDGEEYDAGKEMNGWDKASFNDSKWETPELVEAPGGRLNAQMNEFVKVMKVVKPVSVKELKPGVYIMDMGQNMAGWVKMKVKGNAGDSVVLRFGESLKPDGELYTRNLRDAISTDKYILKGKGTEEWRPSFVYHGFRYVEISSYPGTPSVADFEGEVVYDDVATIGDLETSNQTINQVYKNAWWGIASNYKGMPIDCPQRNERMPWLGDRATGAYGESFVFDNAKLYAKWLDDIEAAQKPDGAIPDVAPAYWNYYSDNVTWPGTYFLVADMLYHQFGDQEPIAKHYASMKKWMDYMRDKYMKNDLITKDKYGDWCVPPESKELIHSKDSLRNTDGVLIATASYYKLLTLMKGFATMLGKTNDVAEYDGISEKIKTAFNNKFFNQNTYSYSNNTVTANLLPLYFDMVPERNKQQVFYNITNKIVKENNSHISTGVIGTQWLMRGLTNNGQPEIAYTLASNKDYPSWGYMVENGATTIWELWNGNTANPEMNSQNHIMLLGDLIVWYYENLAGIKSDDKEVAFKRIIMKPSFVKELSSVNASYHSMYGAIKSSWNRIDNSIGWNIAVPANCKAVIYFPVDKKNIVEKNRSIQTMEGIKYLGTQGGQEVYEIGSGVYSFMISD